MWDSSRDGQHVAWGQRVCVPAVDRVGAQLSVADAVGPDHLAAGDHDRVALHDMHHVDGAGVVFDLARRVAAAGVELVGAGVEQQPARRELRADRLVAEERCSVAAPGGLSECL